MHQPQASRWAHLAALGAMAIAAALYGATFVVVKDVVTEADRFPPMGFNGWRFLIAAVVMLTFFHRRSPRLVRDAIVAGTLLGSGYLFQTIGLVTTSASNSAFITGLYVVLSPLVVFVFLRRLPPRGIAISLPLAFGGLALLTLSGATDPTIGDALQLGAAVAFAGHLTWIAHSVGNHHVPTYAGAQLLVVAILSLTGAAIFERPFLPSGDSYWVSVIGLALAGTCLAYTLQLWSQSKLDPTRAALVLAGEPLIAAVTAFFVRGERLTLTQWIGGASIIAAIVWLETRPRRQPQPTGDSRTADTQETSSESEAPAVPEVEVPALLDVGRKPST